MYIRRTLDCKLLSVDVYGLWFTKETLNLKEPNIHLRLDVYLFSAESIQIQ